MRLAVDVHRLWLVAIPQERRLCHVILGDVVFQTREGYLLLAGGVGTWDRPAHFDKAKLLMRFNLIMLRIESQRKWIFIPNTYYLVPGGEKCLIFTETE